MMLPIYVVLSPLVALFLAQVLKFLIVALQGERDPAYLFRSGGMPSSHIAMVVALAVALMISQGVRSPEFAIAMVVALVVSYDAVNVRRSVGEQREVIAELAAHDKLSIRKLRLSNGHTGKEAFGGFLLGVLVAMVAGASDLAGKSYVNDAQTILSGTEITAMSAFAVLLVLINGLFLRYVRRRRLTKKSEITLVRYGFWFMLVPAILLVANVFGARETIDGLGWRIWSYGILVGVFSMAFILRPKVFKLLQDFDTKKSKKITKRKRRKKQNRKRVNKRSKK